LTKSSKQTRVFDVHSAAEDLRGRGLRVTAQRQAVLAALADKPHATAVELADQLTDNGAILASGMSKQGLYNVLDDLTRVGLVRCIQSARSAARYEVRVGDNHHHVVCRSCGRMEDIDCAVGAAPCLEPAEAAGFVLEEAEVTWWGVCATCRQDTAPPAPRDDQPLLAKEI
jgi:Fur family transcriptional regulator, stress-responsive regulator